MRNTYLFGLGGTLLASTALTAGAQAGTFNAFVDRSTTIVAGLNKPTSGFTSAKIGAQLFGGTGYSASTTIGPQFVFANFTNSYSQNLGPKVVIVPTGAAFDTTTLASSTSAALTLVNTQSSATINSTTTGTASGCSIGVLSTQLQITNCLTGTSSASFSGIGLSGLIYNAATGLATAGASVVLTGSVVENANSNNTYETMTAATVIVSQNTVLVQNTSGTAQVNLGIGATAYTSISQTVSSATSGGLTVVLTQIAFTATGAVYADLTSTGNVSNLVGNLGVVVTSTALSDPAVSNVRFVRGDATTFTNTTLAGTATFSSTNLTGATLFGAAGSGTNYVQVEFNGTASISAAVAGTTAETYIANVTTNGAAIAAVTAGASAISRQGFTVQVNSVQPSTNTVVTSYVRITNGGTTAGTPIITTYNASTGAAMGTFTTSSVPGLATLQLTAKDIETGAGITTPAASGYDLVITGTLPSGYVQHITGNPGNLFVDFSGRRTSNLGVN